MNLAIAATCFAVIFVAAKDRGVIEVRERRERLVPEPLLAQQIQLQLQFFLVPLELPLLKPGLVLKSFGLMA